MLDVAIIMKHTERPGWLESILLLTKFAGVDQSLQNWPKYEHKTMTFVTL